MDVNWPEVLIGGTIFFILGAVFSIFVQPRAEEWRNRRRTEVRDARAQADRQFREEVRTLASDQALFAAVSRNWLARLVGALLAALTLALVGLVLEWFVVIPFMPALFYMAALLMIIPASKVSRDLRNVSAAVADELRPGTIGRP